MSAVDLFILDTMTAPSAMLFGGIDPRRSPAFMAKQVGLTEVSIRTRMNSWRKNGFLGRWHVVPHPAHFEMSHYVVHVRVEDPRARARAAQAFLETEGVVACFEQVGGTSGVGLFARDQAHAEAVADRLLGHEGVEQVAAPGKVVLDPIKKRWDDDHWRRAATLRDGPELSEEALAKSLGVDVRRVEASLEDLAATNGLFVLPELDFSNFQSALVRVIFEVDGDPRQAYASLRERFDTSFYRNVGTEDRPRVHAMVCLRSAVLLDELEEEIAGIATAGQVVFQTPRRFRPAVEYIDHLIAEARA